MKSIFKLSGIIVMIAIIGFSFAACSNGSTDGNTDPKTLIIQGIPKDVMDLVDDESYLILKNSEALNIAAAYLQNPDITQTGSDPFTVSIPIYEHGTPERWTGNGTYVVGLTFQNDTYIYANNSVAFDSATVSVAWSTFTKIKP